MFDQLSDRLRGVLGRRSGRGRVIEANVEAGLREVPLAEYGDRLGRRLAEEPLRVRTAFAAACAQRLLPTYERYVGLTGQEHEGVVSKAIDIAWAAARSGRVPDDARATLAGCEGLMHDEDSDDALPSPVDHAVAAAMYSVQCALDGDPAVAGWAAAREMDALSDYLLADEAEYSREAELKAWTHPLIRAAVDRYEADLARLARDRWHHAVEETYRAALSTPTFPSAAGFGWAC